jgi:hypothetical protein
MSDREDRLRSLLNKVRAKRPQERATRAADALERIRTASGTTAAVATQTVPPAAQPAPPVAQTAPPPAETTPASSAIPQATPEPPTTPGIESPTRYSSQPPHVERPLSTGPPARPLRQSSGEVPAASSRPEPILPQSVAPTGQPFVHATDPPDFPRPKTFGDLLELTLSLRPR